MRSVSFRHILKQSGFLLSGHTLAALFALFFRIALTRLIDPFQLGLLFLTISIGTALSLFIDVRIEESLIQFVTRHLKENEKKSALGTIWLGYSIDFSLGVVIFLFLFFLSPWIGNVVFREISLVWMLRTYAFVLLIQTVNGTSDALLQIFQKYRKLSFLNGLRGFFQLIFPILFIKRGLPGILQGLILASIFSTLLTTYFSYQLLQEHFSNLKPQLRGRLRELFPFASHTTLSTTLKSINQYLGVLLVGFFRGPVDVSYYQIGMTFFSLFSMLTTSMNQVVYPMLTRLWNESLYTEYRKLLKHLTYFYASLFIPFSLFLFLAAEWLIEFFFGTTYLSAAIIIRFAVWGVLSIQMIAWVRPFALSVNRPQFSTRYNFLVTLLFLLLYPPLMHSYGLGGVAMGYSITWFITALCWLLTAFRFLSSVKGALPK